MSITLKEIHQMDYDLRTKEMTLLELNIDSAIREAVRKVENNCMVLIKHILNGKELFDLQNKYKEITIKQQPAASSGYKLDFSWTLPTY